MNPGTRRTFSFDSRGETYIVECYAVKTRDQCCALSGRRIAQEGDNGIRPHVFRSAGGVLSASVSAAEFLSWARPEDAVLEVIRRHNALLLQVDALNNEAAAFGRRVLLVPIRRRRVHG